MTELGRNRLSRAIGLLCCSLLAACATIPPAGHDANGVQLFTVRESMQRDPMDTLRRVAELGYDEVEFAGTFGQTPGALCEKSRALGMSVGASHADWQLLRDDPARAIADAKALCADTVLLAWLPEEQRQTLAQWKWWIDHLNTVSKMARSQGMTLAYHAHNFEFAPSEGVRPIDLLMKDLDPAVGFELDTYWVAKGGEDPLAFLRAHPGRVTLLHLKDITPDGAMADVGEGTLDFAAILAQAKRQGVRHWFVERDDAPDPWASLANSLTHLRALESGDR